MILSEIVVQSFCENGIFYRDCKNLVSYYNEETYIDD